MIDKQNAEKRGFVTVESGSRLEAHSAALRQKLKELLPSLVNSDGKVDAKALQDVLNLANSSSNDQGYELTFAGKGLARAQADSPTDYELKAELGQSKDFHNTKNVVIRGDNIEVLKILYQNYFGKIKMIYIDPPYNTQSDEFVYKDNFKQSDAELVEKSGMNDETADFLYNVYGTRSHSGWLAFMYPRLKLARQLLREDGVIFISIDDHEQANLKLMCDEIFGEENFVGDIIRKTKSTTNDAKTGFNIQHENCLTYAKNVENIMLQGEKKDFSKYTNPDNDPNGNWTSADPSARTGSISFPIKNPYTGKVDYPPHGRCWGFSYDSYKRHVESGRIKFKESHSENERGFIFKRYLSEIKSEYHKVNSLFAASKGFMNQVATKETNILFEQGITTYPKPLLFIKKLISYTTKDNDIILDFFAGSGTTGEAVMRLNKENGGNRKFILVQWDEKIDRKKNEPTYRFCQDNNLEPVISSITIERLNRASKKLTEGSDTPSLDVGYKVYSIVPKPNLINKTDTDETQFAMNVSRKKVLDTLTNMLCATCKPLDTTIECLIENVLYRADNEIYLVGVPQESLQQYKDNKINLDGWADLSLSEFLNLGFHDKSKKENLTIVY